MTIKTLKGVSDEALVKAFNTAFEGYFVPIQLTTEQLLFKIKAEKIDKNISVGVFENQKLIGFILHSTDVIQGKRVVYNAGTGVIPDKRGQQLVQKMYDFIIPSLTELSVSQVLLEVISENTPAIKAYEKIGFRKRRKLNCYKGLLQNSHSVPGIEIEELRDYLYTIMQSFVEVEPSWQNGFHCIGEIMEQCLSLGAFENGELIAYVIYNKQTGKIHQFAVSEKTQRKGIASYLFSELSKRVPAGCSIINVDDRSRALNAFLNSRGFENYLSQWEMKWEPT